jgi:cytochrome c oxidase subunit 1
VASTLGAYVLGLGLLIVLIYLVASLFSRRYAGQNPWHSTGYEWFTQSPPITHNFETLPVYDRVPHDYTKPPEVKDAA